MTEQFYDKPGDVTEAMRDGLARAYSIPGFRDYLLFAIRAANRNAMTCVQKNENDDAKTFAIRMSTLEKLIDQARQCYEKYDEMKRRRKETQKQGITFP